MVGHRMTEWTNATKACDYYSSPHSHLLAKVGQDGVLSYSVTGSYNTRPLAGVRRGFHRMQDVPCLLQMQPIMICHETDDFEKRRRAEDRMSCRFRPETLREQIPAGSDAATRAATNSRMEAGPSSPR